MIKNATVAPNVRQQPQEEPCRSVVCVNVVLWLLQSLQCWCSCCGAWGPGVWTQALWCMPPPDTAPCLLLRECC